MRTDQFLITAVVDGENIGVFDKHSGLEGDSDELKHRPGGMGQQRSYGGPKTLGNVTITRVLEQVTRNDIATARRIFPKRGRAAMSLSIQALDVDGNPFDRPFVVQGKLKTCTLPDSDSDGNALAEWSLVCSTEGDLA